MAREYVISADNVTMANQPVTLIFLNPGTTMSLEVLRARVTQSGTNTAAQVRVQLVRQVTAFPTLTAATPRPLKDRDPASAIVGGTAGAAGTCGVNASAEGAGSKTVLRAFAFNNLNGWEWIATPSDTIILAASSANGFGVFIPAQPTGLTGWHAELVYRELG